MRVVIHPKTLEILALGPGVPRGTFEELDLPLDDEQVARFTRETATLTRDKKIKWTGERLRESPVPDPSAPHLQDADRLAKLAETAIAEPEKLGKLPAGDMAMLIRVLHRLASRR